jgi:Na+(H+)/acetate symporter ActP
MQFLILFIGAMVFVFFLFDKPPLLFHPVELARVEKATQFPAIESRYDGAFEHRRAAALEYKDANDDTSRSTAADKFRAAQKDLDGARADALKLATENDTNYIFLTFVMHYLPAGIVGLVLAVIFTASMSASSGEINSLATVSVIDIYKRHMNPNATDHHYLNASRVATVFWGAFATIFATFAYDFGALIEAVNQVGSLFYGGLLGVFVLAFFAKKVGGTAAFYGVIAGELAIFATARFTSIKFLWYNVIGSLVVIGVGLAISKIERRHT